MIKIKTNNPDLVLLEAEGSDLSAIFLLDQENNVRPYSHRVLKEIFSSDAVIIKAELKGKTIGYVISEIVYEDADIINIVVDSRFRKRGIGNVLLTSAVAESIKRGAKRILLEVEENNFPAISLYKSFGFKQISKRENYYGENSALIMEYKGNIVNFAAQ